MFSFYSVSPTPHHATTPPQTALTQNFRENGVTAPEYPGEEEFLIKKILCCCCSRHESPGPADLPGGQVEEQEETL